MGIQAFQLPERWRSQRLSISYSSDMCNQAQELLDSSCKCNTCWVDNGFGIFINDNKGLWACGRRSALWATRQRCTWR